MSLCSWALSSVVAEICLRAGLNYDKIVLDQLEGTVDGFYMTSANDAFTGIEALSQVYFFDVCNFDGKTNFVMRGGDSVATLTNDDLVDDGRDINTNTRYDTLSVPRVYNLNYYDPEGGLSTDKQTSDRDVNGLSADEVGSDMRLDSRSKSEVRLETTVLMSADQAAQLVVKNHKVAIEEQRGGKEFSLPDSWIWLTVGDIITLEGERLRITEIELSDGFQKYKTVFDRASSYSSTVQGVISSTVSDPPTLIAGDTILHFIDSRILNDADDKLGYYLAVSGDSEAWNGALIELSMDGGTTYPTSAITNVDAVIGELTATLPAHSIYYPDERNNLTVSLLQPSYSLSSITFAEMLSRGNLALVGDEIINFQNATEVSDNVWELTYLLRGRKGSGAVEHSIGERFVLLERSAVGFNPAELYQLGKDLTFRATTNSTINGIEQTVTFTGKSQYEKPVGYLRAKRSGGNIVISWQGSGKLGGGVSIGMGVYFTGYRVTVNGTSQDTTNETVTVTDPGGTVTISVQQKNAITGLGEAAQVII